MTHVALVLAVTTAVQALLSLSVLSIPAVAPALARSLGIDPALVGYQISLVYVTATFGSPIAGLVIRRWGGARTSQMALLFGAIACLLATIPNLLAIAAASLILGLGYGLTNPSAAHLLMRYFTGGNRNLLFSIKQSGVPVGGIFAGLVLPSIAVAYGWQWAIVVPALLCFLVALAIMPVRATWDDDRDPSAGFRGNPFAGVALVWQSTALRSLALAGFCFAFVQLCLMSFIVTLLVQEVNFDLVSAGVAASVIQASGIFGRLFWGWLADRLANALVVLIGVTTISLIACLGTIALDQSWPLAGIYALLATFGLSAMGWNGVYMAEIDRIAGGVNVGSTTGGVMTFTFFGVLCGPALFSTVYHILGSYTLTFTMSALLLATGLALLILADRAAKRDGHSP